MSLFSKKKQPEEEKVQCNHLYGSVLLENDVPNCRDILIFRCAHCGHIEKIPIQRNLIYSLTLSSNAILQNYKDILKTSD